MNSVRSLFRWLGPEGEGHIEAPRFGPDFRRTSRKVERRQKREAGPKFFSALHIKELLDECGVHLRAMVLLGINCGFTNMDCAQLPISLVNLETGWHDFPRPKTEVDRRCPLWPETVEALVRSLESRRKPQPGSEDKFFLLPDGRPYTRLGRTEEITKYTIQALRRAGIRKGGFKWLRHTFQTIGDRSKDPVAVHFIMGHVDNSMAANYRQFVSDDNLLSVTNTVRDWLFSPPSAAGG